MYGSETAALEDHARALTRFTSMFSDGGDLGKALRAFATSSSAPEFVNTLKAHTKALEEDKVSRDAQTEALLVHTQAINANTQALYEHAAAIQQHNRFMGDHTAAMMQSRYH